MVEDPSIAGAGSGVNAQGSPFATAIEAVRKPLALAARVRDLERTVASAAARARILSIPRDAGRALQQVERIFSKPLSGEARAEGVRRALRVLDPLADPAWAEAALSRPVTSLPGVGAKRFDLFQRRGLATVADLLFLLPARYEDRRTLSSVAELEVGTRATFVAQVLVVDFVPARGRGRFRRLLQAVVGDDTGTVKLKWFHSTEALQRTVEKGATLAITGDVKRYRFSRELLHPEVERLDEDGRSRDVDDLRRIVPGYPTPEGIHPRALRRIVQAAVEQYADLVAGLLPAAMARARGLPEPAQALRMLHLPPPDTAPEILDPASSPARQRLVLEELYLLETGLALRRAARAAEPGIAIDMDRRRTEELPRALPFRLTGAQRRSWGEIRADLARPHPMHRLLQGDVGSGKTALAFLAALAVAEAGCQTALMAPTEILAEQHERTLRRLSEAGGEATRLRQALPRCRVRKPRGRGRSSRAARSTWWWERTHWCRRRFGSRAWPWRSSTSSTASGCSSVPPSPRRPPRGFRRIPWS
jgi:ATP-dependent DNA helicase RecG